MTTPPRLALVVAPRLLGDTLARALREVGLDVVIIDAGGQVDGPVDVAVVSGDVGVAIDAQVVVTLPGDDDGGMGSIQRRGSLAQELEIRDVETLVRAVRSRDEQ